MDRRPLRLRELLDDEFAFTCLTGAVAALDWNAAPPESIVAAHGQPLAIAQIALDLQRHEATLSDEHWDALDRAGFAWVESTGSRSRRTVIDRDRVDITTGVSALEIVLTLDRKHPEADLFVEWVRTGLDACRTSGTPLLTALGQPDCEIAVNGASFALGTWARELARAVAYGHLERALPHVRAGDRAMFGPRTQHFLRNVGLFADYTRRTGSTAIPGNTVVRLADGTSYDLGAWFQIQRRRASRGQLSDARRAALEAFSAPLVSQSTEFWWKTALTALDQFRAREGHARVPTSAVETLPDGRRYQLGHWAVSVGKRHRAGRLSEAHRRELARRGFDVTTRLSAADAWARGLAAFDRYIAEHGHPHPSEHAMVTLADGSEFPVGRWLAVRRRSLRRGTLQAEHRRALDARGVDWNPSKTRFIEGLARFEAFVRREGHSRIPVEYVDTDGEPFTLGRWATEVRRALALGRIRPEDEARLDAAGFIRNTYDFEFARRVEALDRFIAREGHANVPLDHVERLPDGEDLRLGGWAADLRSRYKAGRVAKDRIDALDARGFVWDAYGERFRVRLRFLEAFVAREGHARVRPTHVETLPDGTSFPLGRWLVGRREKFPKRGMLPSEADALYRLGCEWADPAKNPMLSDPALQRPKRLTNPETLGH